MLMNFATPMRAASSQRGLSLVELLVGVALGLFLVAGASTLFVNHLGNSRRLLLEARLNQDLRAAADLVTRDLRRAGYWGNSLAGTVKVGAATSTTPNPYAGLTPGTETITYDFSRDPSGAENNTRDANERFVFDRSGGTIGMTINGARQVVTDPDTVTITGFTITPTETSVDIRDTCATTCAGSGCPTITVRQYLLTIAGSAARDPAVTRTLQTRVRVRNDAFAGVCP